MSILTKRHLLEEDTETSLSALFPLCNGHYGLEDYIR